MTLPVSQQRTLDRIERKLRDSDPGLTALFTIFTRLTWNEEIPRIEEIRARLTRIGGVIVRHAEPARRRTPRIPSHVKAILLFPAALAALACALLIGNSGPAAHRCAATVRAPAAELIVKARQCRLTLARTPGRLTLNRTQVPLFAH